MAQELIYTSVPKGLKAGSDGYCTVAYTNGMPANVLKLLESFSDYSFLDLNDPKLDLSPVSFRHYRHVIGAQTFNIISRVAFSGFDYTRRSNKLAHHIVLSSDELSAGGPAWLCSQDIFKAEWNEDPVLFDHEKSVPKAEDDLYELLTWQELAGDMGWAGKLAETYLNNPDKPSYIIYDLEYADRMLSLIREALKLIPEKKRWQVTFNTYFTGTRNTECHWRCCLSGSAVLSKARAIPGTLIIDLTSDIPEAVGGKFVEAARLGQFINAEEPSPSPVEFEKELDTGNTAGFGELAAMPKLSITSPIENSPTEIEQSSVHQKPSLIDREVFQQEKVQVEEAKEKPAVEKQQKEIPPILTHKPKVLNSTPILILIGVIIIILLLIVIVMLMPKSNQTTTVEPHTVSTQQKESSGKTSTKTVAPLVKTIDTEKVLPKKKIHEKKNSEKTEEENTKLPTKPKPKTEDKKELKQTPPELVKHKDIPAEPANVNLWLPYQTGIGNPNSKVTNIPIPWIGNITEFDLIWRPGVLEKQKKDMTGDLIKKSNRKIMIFAEKQDAMNIEHIDFCEFSIPETEKETRLIIKQFVDGLPSAVNLKRDIIAVRINGKEYPLIYNGKTKLQPGEGVIDNSKSGTLFTVSMEYEFTDLDKLAGIAPENGKSYTPYQFEFLYLGKEIDLAPKYSDHKMKYMVNLIKQVTETKKIYKEWQSKLNKELNENRKVILAHFKDVFKFKQYLVPEIKINKLDMIKKEVLRETKEYNAGETLKPFYEWDTMMENADKAFKKKVGKHGEARKKLKDELRKFIKKADELKQKIMNDDLKTLRQKEPKLIRIKLPGKQRQRELENDSAMDFILSICRDINKFCGSLNVVEIKKGLNEKNRIEKKLSPADCLQAIED